MYPSLRGPLVVLLEEDGADEACYGIFVGEDPDDVGAAHDFGMELFDRVCIRYEEVGAVDSIGSDIYTLSSTKHHQNSVWLEAEIRQFSV